jgi:hypothetical protein
VWFNDAEVLGDSLALYNAYSKWGRLAKSASRSVPRALYGLLFRGHPDGITATRFIKLTEAIRTWLGMMH